MNEERGLELKPEHMVYGARVLSRQSSLIPALTTLTGTISISGDRKAMIDVLKEHHVLDPEILTSNEPFFWGAEISSTRLDSYDTVMDPATTLKNWRQKILTSDEPSSVHRSLGEAYDDFAWSAAA